MTEETCANCGLNRFWCSKAKSCKKFKAKKDFNIGCEECGSRHYPCLCIMNKKFKAQIKRHPSSLKNVQLCRDALKEGTQNHAEKSLSDKEIWAGIDLDNGVKESLLVIPTEDVKEAVKRLKFKLCGEWSEDAKFNERWIDKIMGDNLI